MAEKDMTEKTLLGFNDVFAEVVNAYFALSGIKCRIKPDELEDVRSWSMYKAVDKVQCDIICFSCFFTLSSV